MVGCFWAGGEEGEVQRGRLAMEAPAAASQRVHVEGTTVEERYPPPTGYARVPAEEGGFGAFLRRQKLKPYGEKPLYHDGSEKEKYWVYDSVFDVDIGDRDLHQCADAVLLLRGEYLYSIGAYEEIGFRFVSGFKAEYGKWMEGYRIRVNGREESWHLVGEPGNSYPSFRKFMDMVFAYAGTRSLEQELHPVEVEDMRIGDVFIVGGSPGHAAIVVDLAQNREGGKVFLLAQSHMPAQQTELMANPVDWDLSPWYTLEGKRGLVTPEWTFALEDLKRF
ncbi:DUF4846 domain-containing protein [Anaerotalea alkaliphila]|nr:DUF4846 domain-containing protein [Anaerotalea alkaliphila]